MYIVWYGRNDTSVYQGIMVLGNEQAVQLYKCIDGRMETYPDQYGSTISFNSKSLAHTHTHSNLHFWY